MNTKNKYIAEIHIAVFLFGLSGLFGKLINMPSIIIVFGRVLFSSLFLMLILIFLKKDIRLKRQKHYLYLVIMGITLAIHWSSFFKSIQVSTVAIGLLTFSTFPVFVSFLEPYFMKEKINVSDIILAFITFIGVLLVIPNLEISNNITQGALWGILSGFTYAILSVLNRKYVSEYSSLVIAFYEQAVATIILIPFVFLYKPEFQLREVLLLVLLGIVFTGISHSLFINGLKGVKTQTASIISCLEPLYGIVFATLLLKEIPGLRELLGGIIILSTVFYSTIKSK